MKLCPQCNQTVDEGLFCPMDGTPLVETGIQAGESDAFFAEAAGREPEPDGASGDEAARAADVMQSIDELIQFDAALELEEPEPAVASPGDPARPNASTGDLISMALSALEGKRTREQERLRERMRLFDLFNAHCRALHAFAKDLVSRSDKLRYRADYGDTPQRLWVRFVISIGEAALSRRFPVTVAYYREPFRAVRLEINVQEVGQDDDERIFRTEEIGGRVENTRFGRRFVLLAPREVDSEAKALDWLTQSFARIFPAAYGE